MLAFSYKTDLKIVNHAMDSITLLIESDFNFALYNIRNIYTFKINSLRIITLIQYIVYFNR